MTISNNTDSTIGWCSDGSSPPVWVENAAGADKKEQFKADCQSWWRRYSGGPSFYGENCLLRLVASKKQNVCISASNDKPGDTKRLQTAKCNIKDFYQLWDIASVAKEFPVSDCAKALKVPYRADTEGFRKFGRIGGRMVAVSRRVEHEPDDTRLIHRCL